MLKEINSIQRRDYIIVNDKEIVVSRITNKELAQKHADKGIDVFVVKDTPESYLACVEASKRLSRSTKKDAQIDRLVAMGLTKEQAIEVLG